MAAREKISKIKRVMDLFVEGAVCDLGEDMDTQTRVLVWVNKPNSFEEEEARKDGLVARAIRLQELSDPENPTIAALRETCRGSERPALIDQLVQSKYEDDFIAAMDDIEADEKWRDKMEYLRRGATILQDAGVPEGDKRWTDLAEESEKYQEALRKAIAKRQEGRRRELKNTPESELEDMIVEAFKNRSAMDEFMGEKRITELFFALRDCSAVPYPDGGWSHRNCDHSLRLLEKREDVRSLPEQVLQKVSRTLSDVEVDARTAGNSDAPASSSASSEQPSEEVESTPSTPEAMPSVAPTT